MVGAVGVAGLSQDRGDPEVGKALPTQPHGPLSPILHYFPSWENTRFPDVLEMHELHQVYNESLKFNCKELEAYLQSLQLLLSSAHKRRNTLDRGQIYLKT